MAVWLWFWWPPVPEPVILDQSCFHAPLTCMPSE